MIRAGTIDEMFDIAACLDAQPLPRGGRVAIVTNAGGPGILAVDACIDAGLTATEFSPTTCARFAAFLPPTASVRNPVDIVASAGPVEYRQAIEVAATADETDALIVIFTPVDASQSEDILNAIREGIRRARGASGDPKPILACVMTNGAPPVPLRVDSETIPTFAFPENAARALAKISAYSTWRAQPPGLLWDFDDMHVDDARSLCQRALERGDDGWLTTEEAHGVLNACALPVAAGATARTPDEAAAMAASFGFPVVAKLSSRRVLHKTDIGAVRLNLTTAEEVREAFRAIMACAPDRTSDDGVLVQPMITDAVETIIGVTDDPVFGPLVGFGLGGTQVEILGDVQFRIAPITGRDAAELVHEIGFVFFMGYTGAPPGRRWRQNVCCVSRPPPAAARVVELDLNPVMALAPAKGRRG